VVGVGKGTKKLSEFLDCVKVIACLPIDPHASQLRIQEYRTTCLLGCETDTYDSEGARVRVAPWQHVTRELVESKLDQFRGSIQQAPPMSALCLP
jgi:tRNA pseudouridine55 synthase